MVVTLDDDLVSLDEEEAPPTLRDLAAPCFDVVDDDPVIVPMTRPLDGPRRLLERFVAWLTPSRRVTG